MTIPELVHASPSQSSDGLLYTGVVKLCESNYLLKNIVLSHIHVCIYSIAPYFQGH